MSNPHHKYEDASNTWSEIDWTKIPDAPTLSNDTVISTTKLHRLYVCSDKYDYAMTLVGLCPRLGHNTHKDCDCGDECKLVQMHLRWRQQNG